MDKLLRDYLAKLGRKGGRAAAKSMTKAERTRRASKGGKERARVAAKKKKSKS